jgi:hypothetical protein
MGCVWQSEYAPVPKLSDSRVHDRPPARHRKPAWWRRAGGPVLAAIRVRLRARSHQGKVPVLARGR